jgi:hypothetical protein
MESPLSSLRTALDRLVAAGTLTPSQADAVLQETGALEPAAPVPPASASTGPGAAVPGASASSPAWSWTQVLSEVGGYVGGAFVFGAAAVLLADHWGSLGAPVRVGVLAVPSALLLVAASVLMRSVPGGWRARPDRDVVRGGRGARRRLVATFMTVTAALASGAAGVWAHAVGATDPSVALAASLTGLLIAGAGYAVCRIELLHLVSGIGLVATVLAVLSRFVTLDLAPVGTTLACVGVVWAALATVRILAERSFGYGLAGVLLFIGGEELTVTGSSWTGYLVLGVLAITALAGFVALRALVLLVVGVITLATVVPQAVIDVTDGALGASGALLVVGLSIVGASVLGIRLHRAPPEHSDQPQHA